MAESALHIAAYISQRYKETFGESIDEMKLHKLLYFAQRESFVLHGVPLFDEVFHGGKYGPVMLAVRSAYKNNTMNEFPSSAFVRENSDVFDKIFSQFAPESSLTLSDISHGEYSWQHAREGVSPFSREYKEMLTADIQADAEHIKQRRALLNKIFGKQD